MSASPAPFVVPQAPGTAPVVSAPKPVDVTPSATTPKAVAPTLQQPKGQAVTDNKPKPRGPQRSPGNKVIGAKVIVQYRAEDGTIHEATTTIDPEMHIVQGYTLDIQEKHQKTKAEDGSLLGFEDTGERTLLFKLRYHERF